MSGGNKRGNNRSTKKTPPKKAVGKKAAGRKAFEVVGKWNAKAKRFDSPPITKAVTIGRKPKSPKWSDGDKWALAQVRSSGKSMSFHPSVRDQRNGSMSRLEKFGKISWVKNKDGSISPRAVEGPANTNEYKKRRKK
jgi:hypothetical protein